MQAPTETLRCWAEIDLSAIRHNATVARELAGPGAGVMAIVKANAYGHGLPEIAHALRDIVTMYGVANLQEAQALRKTLGAGGPDIFILGAALPGERPAIVAGGFVPAISSVEEAAAYSALSVGRRLPIHLVIDTGMGRMGIAEADARDVVQRILGLTNLGIAGIATHLPVADEDETYTHTELDRFEKIVASLRELGVDAPFIHSLNSAGIFRFSPHAGSMVRAGLMLYGISPLAEYQRRLRPALALKTRIILIRHHPAGHGISYGRTFVTPAAMRVATLCIGYADGYHRRLSNQDAAVLIHGQRCPLLGRVTMDQIMADVSHIPDAAIGDEAILIGASGTQEIPATELAAKAGTIPWEIFTSIGTRVERIYR